MHIKPFLATYPRFDRIPASPDVYCAQAKHAFLEYQHNQWLAQTGQPAIYIYLIEAHHRRHTGLVALNDVQDFFVGKVKKHEKTLSEREQHQKELLLRWGAVLKPILLTFAPVQELKTWMEAFIQAHTPLFTVHFKKDGQTHQLWAVEDDTEIRFLQDLFVRQVPGVYIADGHHRTSTLALLHQHLKGEYPHLDFDYLFCAYFATDQLDILDYNRVVEGLNGLSPEQLFGRLSQVFEIEYVEYPRKPRKKYQLKLFFRGHWYRLHWKPEVLTAWRPSAHTLPVLLDVSMLNELVLRQILGIRDVRTDARITYVEGSKGLNGIRKVVGNSAEHTGFVLFPVSFDDMMHIADTGKSLPPKSTFFEPRMKTGILIKMLDKEPV